MLCLITKLKLWPKLHFTRFVVNCFPVRFVPFSGRSTLGAFNYASSRNENDLEVKLWRHFESTKKLVLVAICEIQSSRSELKSFRSQRPHKNQLKMSTVVRMKRLLSEEPHQAFVLNCKKRKTDDPRQTTSAAEASTVLKFVGTVDDQVKTSQNSRSDLKKFTKILFLGRWHQRTDCKAFKRRRQRYRKPEASGVIDTQGAHRRESPKVTAEPLQDHKLHTNPRWGPDRGRREGASHASRCHRASDIRTVILIQRPLRRALRVRHLHRRDRHTSPVPRLHRPERLKVGAHGWSFLLVLRVHVDSTPLRTHFTVADEIKYIYANLLD